MSKKGFDDPEKDRAKIKAQLEEWESRNYGSSVYWKPKENATSEIRIVPGKDGASFHCKAGKHFIRHDDMFEIFICSYETYGEKCPACEEFRRLKKAGDKKAASVYKPTVFGAFHIIDRAREENGVQLWEAPGATVWGVILRLYTGEPKKFNTLIDPVKGRNIFVTYNKDADPKSKYTILLDEVSPLGNDEQIALWIEETVPLVAEVLYPAIAYEDAEILTFGSPQDRAELHRELERKTRKEETDEGGGGEESGGKEDNPEITRLKKQLEKERLDKAVAEAKIAVLEKKSPEEEKIESAATARAEKENEEEKSQEDLEIEKLKEALAVANLKKKEAEAKADALRKLRDPKSKKDDVHTVEEIRAKISENK